MKTVIEGPGFLGAEHGCQLTPEESVAREEAAHGDQQLDSGRSELGMDGA